MDTATDLYPSRGEGPIAPIERHTPVVYPGPQRDAGPLSPQALAQYEKDGYLFLESLFHETEVEALQREMDALRGNEKVRQSEIAVTEALSGEIRSIFAVHTVSDIFRTLAADRRLLGIVRQILGSDVYLHQSRVNYKPGFRGKEFYWHSDFETWHCEDGLPEMRTVSCSIALTPNYPYNGPLMVMPGSHRHFFPCEGHTPEDHYLQSLKKQDYGVPNDEQLQWMADRFGIVAPLGPVGSVTLFDCNLMHGSNGNITPYPRSNAFFVYNSTENLLEEPFAAAHRRPWYLGNRSPEPLEETEFVPGEAAPALS